MTAPSFVGRSPWVRDAPSPGGWHQRAPWVKKNGVWTLRTPLALGESTAVASIPESYDYRSVGYTQPTGNITIPVDVPIELGASQVWVQISHPDNGPWVCVQDSAGSAGWHTEKPLKTLYSIKGNRTSSPTARTSGLDYPYWIRPFWRTTQGVFAGDWRIIIPNNYSLPRTGGAATWDASDAFTADMSSVLNWQNKYREGAGSFWGSANNNDGTPTVTRVVDATFPEGVLMRSYMKTGANSPPNGHPTSDQPNDNIRIQGEPGKFLAVGTDAWVRFAYRLPAGWIAAQDQERSVFQFMEGPDYTKGLKMMLTSKAYTPDSYSDVKPGFLHVIGTDRNAEGEPACLLQVPEYKTQVVEHFIRWRSAYNALDGRVGPWYIRLDGGPLQIQDLHGIPGQYEIPALTSAQGNTGPDPEMQAPYMGRAFPATSVTMDVGQQIIGPTLASIDMGRGGV